jgi:cell wall-associated NlpC family hydrolase
VLPRTSAEQANEGTAVSKKLGTLVAGDLLTFSNRGGPVSHVGLYVGEGRFIHSASRGVQISILSAEDPYGRWWFKRWVGVRRIIGD